MSALDLIKIEKGQVLFNEGDLSEQMYFLKSGKLKVTRNLDDKEVVLGNVTPGELVGEISFFDKNPRTATVVADEDSELAVIPADKFKTIFDELPSWYQVLTNTLIKRVRNVNKTKRSTSCKAKNIFKKI